MTVVDRAIVASKSSLANFELTGAQPWYWTVYFSSMAFFTITQVFVGTYNGAKKNVKAGSTVWSMLVLAFGMWLFIMPTLPFISMLLSKNLETYGVPYLQIVYAFMPFAIAGFGVIGSFFIGRGKVYPILYIFLMSNLLNIILTYVFVCKVNFGPCGAAYATGISQIVAFLLFLKAFLSKENVKICRTNKILINTKILLSCIKVGLPNAISSLINLTGLSLIFQMLAIKISQEELTAYGMAHATYIFFYFIVEGIGKGTSSIISNFLGAQALTFIRKTIISAVILNVSLFSIASYFMIIDNTIILKILGANSMNQGALLYEYANSLFFWAWLFFSIECSWVILQGVLTAIRDTRFTMVVNIISFWFITMLPTFLFVFVLNFNSTFCWQILAVDVALRTILFYRRCPKWLIFKEKC